MAKIIIHDLQDSVELDNQAMTAVIGGARTTGTKTPRDPRTLIKTGSSEIMKNVFGAEKLGG